MRNPLALLTFFLNSNRWETLVFHLAGIWLSLGYNVSQGYAGKCARDEKQVYVAQIWSKDISQGYGLVSLCGIPLAAIWLSQGYNAGICPRDMQGNVPAIRSRYISHRHVGKTCPRDMVKSHCVGSHLAGIWLSQGYNSRIYPRNMRGNVPGTRSRYMSHRYAAKICPRDIVKSQSLHCQMLG